MLRLVRYSCSTSSQPVRLSQGEVVAGMLLFVGYLTSQQRAGVSQGRVCSDDFTCCHTEIEVADQTFYLTQSQYTDTGPTNPRDDPITPGAWQGSHRSANFEVTGMIPPGKISSQSGFEPRIFRSRGGHLNHKANEAVCCGEVDVQGERWCWLSVNTFMRHRRARAHKHARTYIHTLYILLVFFFFIFTSAFFLPSSVIDVIRCKLCAEHAISACLLMLFSFYSFETL